MKTKILSFYLPQYHQIPENDEWWGEGFTEWTNVRKAQSFFKGHHQPRIPKDNNYYMLDDPNSLRWQADLMAKYSVDGMCFYHYWFNGKQLLQKPLEILLENQDIDMPFCLSWANEPWTRAWDGGEKEVIMPQAYGEESDWISHFNYLYKAFKDDRYIRVNGKPMILIYRAASIPCLDDMLACWNRLAVEKGLSGLHLVSMNTSFKDPFEVNGFDATVDFEPMHTIGHHLKGYIRYKRGLSIRFRHLLNRILRTPYIIEDQISYSTIWEDILSRQLTKNNYAGAFVDWDNTARKAERGLIMHGASPKAFHHYLSKQYIRCVQQDVPFIFVNAWNEWAEGTYLEPDSYNRYGYLEAIKRIKNG